MGLNMLLFTLCVVLLLVVWFAASAVLRTRRRLAHEMEDARQGSTLDSQTARDRAVTASEAGESDFSQRWTNELQACVSEGRWDQARRMLREIAWTTHRDSTPEFKDLLKSVGMQFAMRDPLYAEVSKRVIEIVKTRENVLQKDIYVEFPEVSKDDMQYVLYYASALGDIVRIKKGNTYLLALGDHLMI